MADLEIRRLAIFWQINLVIKLFNFTIIIWTALYETCRSQPKRCNGVVLPVTHTPSANASNLPMKTDTSKTLLWKKKSVFLWTQCGTAADPWVCLTTEQHDRYILAGGWPSPAQYISSEWEERIYQHPGFHRPISTDDIRKAGKPLHHTNLSHHADFTWCRTWKQKCFTPTTWYYLSVKTHNSLLTQLRALQSFIN
jgi:hypothetical protein